MMAPVTDEELVELPFSELKDIQFQGMIQSLLCNHSRDWPGGNVARCHPTSRNRRSRNYLRGFTLRKLKLESKDGGDNKASLATFLELPLEIILEVFGHAHPLDLYHLSTSSKWLREVLLSAASISVWQSSFVRHEDAVPVLPERLTSRPAAWAAFLFGPTVCEVCGGDWAELDLTFVQKLCQACRRVKMITGEEFYALCSEFEDDYNSDQGSNDSDDVTLETKIFQLCRESHWVSVNLLRSDSNSMDRDFRKDEVLEALRLVCGTDDIVTHEGKVVPRKAAIASKSEQMSGWSDVASRCYMWADGIFAEIRDFETEWYKARAQKYFRAVGYAESDLADLNEDDIAGYLEVRELQGLSKRKDLKYHLAILEHDVCRRRAERIQEERREILLNIYKQYKGSRPFSEWRHLPPHSSLIDSTPLFKNLFSELPCGDPRVSSWSIPESAIVEGIPTAVSMWRQQLQQEMLALIPDSVKLDCQDQRGVVVPFDDDGDVIGLAIIAFECRCFGTSTLNPCFGWDDILSHRCVCSATSGIQWSEAGYLAVKAVLKCLNLDPWTTKPQDLDTLNARFFCAGEEPYMSQSRGGYYFRRAITWRECVIHALGGAPRCSKAASNPSWFLLTSDATKFVHSREHEWPRFKDPIWACTHCTEHFDKLAPYPDVESHVKERHGIPLSPPLKQPIPYPCGEDIVHMPQASYRDGPRNPVFYQVDPPIVRCLLCLSRQDSNNSDGKTGFGVPSQKLEEHFSNVHSLGESVKGRDWEEIQAYYA